MTPELARAALGFLARCDLKGVEAATLVAVANALKAIEEGRAEVVPVEEGTG